MRVASNFPTAYVRVASQTYVLQHILYKQLFIIYITFQEGQYEGSQWSLLSDSAGIHHNI